MPVPIVYNAITDRPSRKTDDRLINPAANMHHLPLIRRSRSTTVCWLPLDESTGKLSGAANGVARPVSSRHRAVGKRAEPPDQGMATDEPGLTERQPSALLRLCPAKECPNPRPGP